MSKGIGIVSLLGMLLLVGGIFANEAEVFLYVPTSFSEESFVSEEGEVSDVLDVLPGWNSVRSRPVVSRPVVPRSVVIRSLLASGDSLDSFDRLIGRDDEVLESVVSPEVEHFVAVDTFDVKDIEGTTLAFLQKVFEQTQDPQVMNAILQELIDTYQFLAAKQFVEKLTPRLLRDVEVHLLLQSAFNSFSLSSDTRSQSLQAVVDEQYQTAKLSKEEYERYGGIIVLMQKDYATFFEKAKSFKQHQYVSFATQLQTFQTQIANQSDMPSYYFDALVAMSLFNQGYFQPAKVLALSVLRQDKEYILPYQILAYASFLTNAREAAIEYLTTLSTLEPALREKYDFLIGVASYRNQQYTQSVLKLSQVKEERYRLDAERYLALNYVALKQYSKLLSSREKILGYKALQTSDFYSYFYQALFVPYFKWESPTLYLQNPSLAQKYLTRCWELFLGKEAVICNYGQIGYQLHAGTTNAAGFEEILKKLIEHYPQGYLFHALGERYLTQGKPEEAKPYLVKAIGMTRTSEQALQLKALLQKAM